MKKRLVLATILCTLAALMITGCGAIVDDSLADKEEYSVEEDNDDEDDDWDDDDWDDDEYVPSVDEIVGVWYEQDALDPRTLFVYDDWTFSLQYQGGGSLDGTVEITEEEHPDDEEDDHPDEEETDDEEEDHPDDEETEDEEQSDEDEEEEE